MKRILIADDEPHVSMLLKQFLERAGYQVYTVLNGEQALSQISCDLPDVIITDVQMPKMNGIQMCEAIKQKMPQIQSLIIMMTSRTDSEIRIWADANPHIKLMEKPLSMRRLAAYLSSHFENISDK